MAIYRFNRDQEHVVTGLQTEDGATLVCQPGDLVDTTNLDDSLRPFFDPAGPAKKGQQARKAVAVPQPAPPEDEPAGEPAAPTATSASDTEEK